MTGALTESLCPVCLKRISAQKIVRNDKIYLVKECDLHGHFEALLWRGAALYDSWSEGVGRGVIASPDWEGTPDCPYTCGLCSEHSSGTCTAIFHLTDVCNMKCPVCFADAGHAQAAGRPSQGEVRLMYEAHLKRGAIPSVQLSGGEATTRDDLPEIIRMGKNLGAQHIQVNTNGLRLAVEPAYAEILRDAGADLIYLQFDGVTDSVYQALRGRPLLDIKMNAVSNCARAGLGVLLVPTIFPGVNDSQIGAIVSLAKEWMPTVKGIHFQPVSYFGRFPTSGPRDEDRVTLPDVINALEVQTDGEIPQHAMVPRRPADAHCSFSSVFILNEKNRLHPITERLPTIDFSVVKTGRDPFTTRVNTFTNKFWRMAPDNSECQDAPPTSLTARLKNFTLSISGMPFQDVWSIDLQRLRGCCVHVTTPKGQLIPLCAYYLTSTTGRRLYGTSGSA